ncbi:MAG: hypothetical protein ACXWXN_04185 [Actinomycetota bacterium]
MRGTHPRRTVATVGVAGAGLVLGHWLAYALGTPHAHARDELLHATGHGYLPYATQVALLAGALGLAALFLARLSHREARGSFPTDAIGLAAVQSITFIALEVGERLASGASLHDLVHGNLLAIGIAVQVSVAIAGAGVLRLTDRAAEAAEALADITASPVLYPVAAVAIAPAVAPRRPVVRAAASRAPPSLP